MTTILRGCLVSFVLHNATDLDSGANESSAALTLITTDVSKISEAFSNPSGAPKNLLRLA